MKIIMISHKQQLMIEKKAYCLHYYFIKTHSVIQDTSGPSTISTSRAQNS